jgi:hypothetical protein
MPRLVSEKLMSQLLKKTEVAANIAIVVVAILLGVVLVRKYLLPDAHAPIPPVPTIAPGTKLSLPNVDWQVNGRTLLLALSTTCRFCTESGPFYQRVAQERAKNQNIRLVAVFPQSVAEAQKYLSDMGVTVDEVREARLDSIGVMATPTLILANAEGAVVESWVGKLPGERESELLAKFK